MAGGTGQFGQNGHLRALAGRERDAVARSPAVKLDGRVRGAKTCWTRCAARVDASSGLPIIIEGCFDPTVGLSAHPVKES